MQAWLYRCTKAQLSEYLATLNLDPSGGIDTLRKRLRNYLAAHPETALEMVNPTGATAAATGRTTTAPPITVTATTPDTATIMTQMRKWGCTFDGRDPFGFLERLDELREGYGYPGEYLIRGLPELLRGEVLLWFRNNREAWGSWEDFDRDFRNNFLPRRYRAQIRRDIQGRTQRPNEAYCKYETAVLTMMRRAGGFTEEDRLERIYENMDPNYKLYVRLDELDTLQDLRDRATEFETIETQRRAHGRERETAPQPTVAAAAYNRAESCWRCKQRGHTRADCRRTARKFCSFCGRDGVLTRDCHPPAGNAQRVEGQSAATRPEQPSA